MASKKSLVILLCILMLLAWSLGSVVLVGAETLKGRMVVTTTKDEKIPVDDQPGHVLGIMVSEGLTLFENGEIAKARSHAAYDLTPEKGSQAIVYTIVTFDDESTIVIRVQRLMVPDGSGNLSAKATSELIKGTGRFEGIKGTASSTGKNILASKGEAAKSLSNFTWTYTLPTK